MNSFKETFDTFFVNIVAPLILRILMKAEHRRIKKHRQTFKKSLI